MIDLKKLPILYLAPEIPALSATFVYNEIGKLRELGYQVTVASVHAPIAEVDQETKQKVGEVFVVYQSSFALNLLADGISHPTITFWQIIWLVAE
jgi:colanic acid/amylovoran biosynthesis glycosyltransferase